MYGLVKQGTNNMSTSRKRKDLFSDMFNSDSLFDDLFRYPTWTWTTNTSTAKTGDENTFSYKSVTTDTGAKVTIDMPGVKVADAAVYLDGETLIVEGKRDEVVRRAKFTLDGYDPSTLKASHEDGVLTIIVDKKTTETKNLTKIDIEVKK